MTSKQYSDYKFAGGANALVEVVLSLNFGDQLQKDTFDKLESAANSFSSFLPETFQNQGMVLEMEIENGVQKAVQQKVERDGFQRRRISSDGSPEWSLDINRRGIFIHCMSYSSWGEFWSQAEEIITVLFLRLGYIPNVLSNVGLKIVDGFEYVGELETYSINDIFNLNNGFIPENLMNKANKFWHCHTGWFEDADSDLKCLNQLNIGAAVSHKGGKKTHITTIEHTLTLVDLENGDVGTELGDLSEHNIKFVSSIKNMHESNKETLKNLLQEDLVQKIGI